MKKFLCLLSLCAFIATAAVAADTEFRASWWGGANRHEATLKTIEIFEQENPGVVVKGEYTGFPGYLERTTMQIAANAEPEMMQMNWAWLSVFSKDGTGFADLNNFKDVLDLTQYDQKWLDMTTINGKLNAIPVSFTAPVFLLNKSTYDKAGVALPKTWEDYVEAGKAFKEKLGDDYYPIDALHTGHAYMLNSYIYQKTGHQLVNPADGSLGLTREELVEMFSFYRKLIDNHAIVPLQLRSNISGNMETAPNEIANYLDGRWACHYGWDGTIAVNSMETGKRFELAIGDYPTQDGAKNSGHVGRPNMVWTVSKNSAHPEIGAKLINMLVNDPRSVKFQKVDRGVPLSKAAVAALMEDNLIVPLSKAGADQLANAGVSLSHPHLENPRVLQPYMAMIEQVSHEAVTPEEAADSLSAELTRVLNRLNRE